MFSEMKSENDQWEVVVIGGGQAGLATGYYLKKMNKRFIILDEGNRVGDSWRKRWDSLMLFTPAKHDRLPGLSFPGPGGHFPGKDEMADYLEQYAKTFSLQVMLNAKVSHLSSVNEHFEIETSVNLLTARCVVITTGTNPHPKIPSLSADLSSNIFQIHSSAYVNPDSLPPGDVLVVGAATSGMEIALELSKTHKTFISGNPPFHIPDNLFKYGGELYWWIINNVITEKTPIGRKVKDKISHSGSPLIRISADDLKAAGIKSLPRVAGVNEGYPMLEDKSIVKVRSVVWATGYKPDYSWIDMNITNEQGWPVTRRGISTLQKGLYFVGMPFQFGLTSGLVGGIGRDAAYVSRYIQSEDQNS
jgi:putative flavoprotein involved in K+ transport